MALEPIQGQIGYDVDSRPVMGLVDALRELQKQSDVLASHLEASGSAGLEAGRGLEGYEKSARAGVTSTADLVRGAEQLSNILSGLTDFLGQSVAAAGEYGTAIEQIATLSPEAAAGTAQWRQEILEVSAAMGQDAVGAANAVYDALSSGVPPDNVISFMETASKAAVAGATDTGVAVSALSATMNAWKLDASEAGRVSDVFFTGVNVGVFRFEDLASSIGQVAPLAASLGVTYQEVTAATATLTKGGLSASQAITQQRASMIALLTPNVQMTEVLGELAAKNADVKRTAEEQGISIAEASLKVMGYQGTLVAVADAADSAGIGLAQAMGSSEALGAVLGLTGENAAGAAADLRLMEESGGATEGAFDIMSQTFDMASKQLEAQVNVAMIEVGTTLGQLLVPILQRTTEILTGLIEGWRGLDEGTRQAIVTIVGLLAVIGSGLGVWVSLQGVVAAVGPLFMAATEGVTLFSGALAASGIGVAVLAIGAVVKGMHDAGAALDEAGQSAVKAGGGWDDYVASVKKANGEMGLLGQLVGGNIMEDEARTTRLAANSWLEYGVGVNKAIIDSGAFQLGASKLEQQLSTGAVTTEEYKEQVLQMASAMSEAEGYGRVLSEAQREQADSLAAATAAAVEKQGVTGQALAQDSEWARTNADLAANVATGQMTLEQYSVAMQAYTQGRMAQIEADRQAAEAAGVAAGTLQQYSDSFTSVIAAGSKWTADQQAMAQATEESWNTLSQGLATNLQEQWTSRQKYHEDIEAARQADAEAAAGAQQKLGEAEAGHAEKMIELNARMEDAKTEKQRASAEKAIAKENEKLAGILSATESVGGANVAKVEEQYQQQVEAQREALAQMVVDHVTNMVLLGQTSEETAKTIFATLRQAYPGVEVFSPVADAHVALMATIRDATDESSVSQVESIARLPEAMEGAVGAMEEDTARADATMDTWATGAELLAQRHGQASTDIQVANKAAAGSVDETGAAIVVKQDELGESAENRARRVLGATEEEIAAHDAGATAVDESTTRIKDSSTAMTDHVSGDAKSVEGATSTLSGGYGMAASEIEQAVGRMTTATSGVSAATSDFATKMGASQRDLLPVLEQVEAKVQSQATAITKARDTADEAGRVQTRSHQETGRAAEEAGGQTETAMQDASSGMEDAAAQAAETAEAVSAMTDIMKLVPPEIVTLIVLRGVKEAVGDLEHLRGLLDDLGGDKPPNLPGPPSGGGGGGRGRPVGTTAVPSPGGAEDTLFPDDPFGYGGGDGAMGDGSGAFTDRIDEARGAIEELRQAAEDPIVIPAGFEDSMFLAGLAEASELLRAAQAEADELLVRLNATFQGFLRGGAAEQGSMAWLLEESTTDKWQVDFGAIMAGMNVPVKDVEGFLKYFDQLDPEEQVATWKRLYDDLKKQENERHEQRKAGLEEARKEAKDTGRDTGWIVDEMHLEDDAHEARMTHLEERDTLIKRQFEDLKNGLKDVRDAERDLEKIEKDRARAVQEYIREQIRLLKERQKADELFDKRVHDRVLELIAEERDALEKKHDRQDQRVAEAQAQMKAAHEQRLADIQSEADAIKDYMDDQEDALKQAKLDLDEWIRQQPLAQLKDDLKAINDAMRALPTGREGKGGRERAKPEDMVRVDLKSLKDGQKIIDTIQQGIDQGVFTGEDLRLAQIAVQTGSLRLDYLRSLLEAMQKAAQGEVSAVEDKITARKNELADREAAWAREKKALEDQLEIIEDKKRVEDERYKLSEERMAKEKAELETSQKAELDHLDRLALVEKERHDQRMRQLEEEYALQLMIAEGISPEEAARRIADLRAAAAKAMAEAERLFAELSEGRSGVGTAPVLPVPIVPVVAPGPSRQRKGQGEPPGAPGATMPFGETPVLADMFNANLERAAMTIQDFAAMMNTLTAEMSVGGGGRGVGVVATGPTSVANSFSNYGTIVIPDEEEEAQLLRASLGAWAP